MFSDCLSKNYELSPLFVKISPLKLAIFIDFTYLKFLDPPTYLRSRVSLSVHPETELYR